MNCDRLKSTRSVTKKNRLCQRRFTCETLEARHLLAGDLVAQWNAEDLVAENANGNVIASWADSIQGIEAVSSGSPSLLHHSSGGRASVRFDPSDGADSFLVKSEFNPLTRAKDFSVMVAFATSSDSHVGEGEGIWFDNSGIVDANRRGFGNDWGLSINSNGQIATGMGAGFGSPTTNIYSSGGQNDGTLHTAIVTRSANVLSLFIDDADPVVATNASSADRSNLDLAFGALADGNSPFDGEIAQVRFYDGALSADEVGQLQAEIEAFYGNSAPTANDDEYSAVEDRLLLVVPSATGVLSNDIDADGDPITAQLVEAPENGHLTLNADGSFIYSLPVDFFGPSTFSYTANDLRPGNVATVTIQVEPVYDPATAVADSYNLLPTGTNLISADNGLLKNDLNPDKANLVATIVRPVDNGSLSLNEDGSFEYSADGFIGEASFSYQLDDGTRLSNVVDVTLHVNTPPVTVDDSYELDEDIELVIEADIGLLANDEDAEGDTLVVELTRSPEFGSVRLNENGSFFYTANENYFGDDSFAYRVGDGVDISNESNVALRIHPINDAPTTDVDSYFVFPGNVLEVPVDRGVLVNDFDVEGDVITAELSQTPVSGEITFNADGSFVYSPEDGFQGEVEFRYRATDGTNRSSETRVAINVDPKPLVISEFLAANSEFSTRVRSTTEDDFGGFRTYPDWVEIHNLLQNPIDLSDFQLTDDEQNLAKWQFPEGTEIPAFGYLTVFASGQSVTNVELDEAGFLHADFELSAAGDYLAISATNGQIVHEYEADFPSQIYNVSYGIENDQLRYFATPTPNAANENGSVGFAAPATLNQSGGFFDAPFELTATGHPDQTIRYTLDGSEPTASNGMEYVEPITISQTTTFRVAAIQDNYLRSPIKTETFVFLADVIRQSPNGEAPEGWPADRVRGQVFDYGMAPLIVDSEKWGPSMIDALTEIPTISVVTDMSNLIEVGKGIYVHAGLHGFDWERPASVELLNPDGSDGFQIDAGIRIRGGFSRNAGNPKHSFRLFFRNGYGGGELEFPLFGSEGTDRFKAVDLRTAQNYAWSNEGNDEANNTFLRDIFTRDLQGAQGRHYTRGRYYHLYLNGQYWGMYQTEERPEANFAATYAGGNPEDYNAIKASGGILEATDGSLDPWFELWEFVHGGIDNYEDYFRLQGKNADGTDNLNMPVYVDIDQLIDFVITVFYTGNFDMPIAGGANANNFWAFYNPNTRDGWTFIAHDNEHSMIHLEIDRTQNFTAGMRADSFNPQYIHQQLNTFPEYQLRFADRVHKYFFNDGLLTTERAQESLRFRAEQIDLAIIAEAARWGDQGGGEDRDKDDWLAAVDWLENTFMPQRPEIVMNQFRNRNFYPALEAPAINKFGGSVDPDFEVTLTAPQGTIYYTTDGSDPRLVRGDINESAAIFDDDSSITLTADTTVKARVRDGESWSALVDADFLVGPATTPDALRITEIHYNPSDASEHEASLGYDNNDDFEFIELMNTSNSAIDLSLVSLAQITENGDTDGVAFSFSESPIQRLGPGQRIVVVEDKLAFEARYGKGLPVAGQWRGRLSNSSETISLMHGGELLQRVEYLDDWHALTDGEGFSLEIINPNHLDLERWNQKEGWLPSRQIHGTPGRASVVIGDANGDGVFNSDDLLSVFQSGEFEDAIVGNSDFSEGDWNGDGEFDSRDFVFAFTYGIFHNTTE